MKKYPYDRLRQAREGAGYRTADAFAKAHDLSDSTYRSHENGARGLTVAVGRHYGELLGVPWTWIMTGEAPLGPNEKAGKGAKSPTPRPAPAARRPRVDIEILSAIVERVEANLERRHRKMSPMHKAELIATSYGLVEELGLEAATRELHSGLRTRARPHAKTA
jgi:DNA-binding XRE family transcriptional regulator